MGCLVTHQIYSNHGKNPHAVLTACRDKKGRFSVPSGRLRLEMIDQNLSQLPGYTNTNEVLKLDVSDNQLVCLPKGMGDDGWRNLAELTIRNNHINQIPDAVASLSSLTALNLGGNHIERNFEVITKCRKLRSLSLTQTGLTTVPVALRESTTLRHLTLTGNTGIALNGLGQMNLDSLDVDGCGLKTVPIELAACKNLTALSIGRNPLSPGAFLMLSELPHLQNLIAHKTNDIMSQVRHIYDLNIKLLDISHNTISSASGINQFRSLQVLDISYCNLSELPRDIARLPSLTELSVVGNSLRGLAELDPKEFPNLAENLEMLNVSCNKFTSLINGMDMVWKIIGGFTNLRNLSFRGSRNNEKKNTNPYSTSVPLPLLGLKKLTSLNGLPVCLDESLGHNLVTLLKNGYMKPDMGINWSYGAHIHTFLLKTFLQNMNDLTSNLPLSIHRYKAFLYLQHRHSNEALTPPLDVALLAFIHLANPIEYRKDCLTLFGKVVRGPRWKDDAGTTQVLWTQSYGDFAWGVFDHPQQSLPYIDVTRIDVDDGPYEKRLPTHILNYDFSVSLVDGIRACIPSFTEGYDAGLLVAKQPKGAVEMYQKFLALQAKHFIEGKPRLAVTPSIKILAEVHQFTPIRFYDVVSLLTENRFEEFFESSSGASTHTLQETAELWFEAYGESYVTAVPVKTSNIDYDLTASPNKDMSPVSECRSRSTSSPRFHYNENISWYNPKAAPRRSSLKPLVVEPHRLSHVSVRFAQVAGS